jgi:2-amino-4-hydroxy-6-hydroxymethyldihydropteridine diphosphokinase
MAIVYIAVGSNVGDRQTHIQKAVALLRENEDTQVLAVSSLIETAPEGLLSQGKFLNGALKIKTDLMPVDLLGALKNIERRCGRTKSEPNAPRTLDLDILFYDDVVIVEGKTLSIPHPRLHERLFVLKPLSEIAPELVHPRLQKTVRELLDALAEPTPPSR